ncbi:MAG: N-acetylmuramidase family protein [Alphaproteobacteria bacterium]|nr:N-acetylmuramidase family protein [Alphaproteobacteria bacterium]MBV9583679.1 N-acetylmuramidase family protein [Alphaproteobacteria bacterium]
MNFTGPATPLSDANILAEAARLGCDPAAIGAVCDIESAGSGFLPDTRPKLLFEAHVFGKLTRHCWDDAHPNISAPSWDRALYGPPGAHQYDRLEEALALDEAAALEAASWGLFQILGSNFAVCGFASVQDYVAAMCRSEADHLAAFGEFCRHGGLDRCLRMQDWTRFALAYNGPSESDNGYDEKLAAAYLARLAGIEQ